jgi:hypothetical protein
MDSAGPARASESADHMRRPEPSVVEGQELISDEPLLRSAMRTFGAGDAPRPNPRQLMAMQRLAGNRAVARGVAQRQSATAVLQRHTEGTELPNKEAQIGEIQEKEQADPVADQTAAPAMAPEATRTKAETKSQKKDAKATGTAFKKQQKLTPGAMSLAGAQKILQGQFGGTKDIVPGTIVMLANQAACSAKYDEVCMASGVKRPDGSDWAAGDCAKDDAAAGVQTEGFAWAGVVYVNGETTLVTATAHEILHNNTAPAYRGAVGETINEGTTEIFARRALKSAGVKVPSVTAYPDQVRMTEKLEKLVGGATLVNAYFSGPATLVDKFEELKGVGTWANLKLQAEALDERKFKKALSAKKVK